jgi:hypothetical protein
MGHHGVQGIAVAQMHMPIIWAGEYECVVHGG